MSQTSPDRDAQLDSSILRIAADASSESHCRSATVNGLTCWVIAGETVCDQVLKAFERKPAPQVPSLPRGVPLAVLVAGGEKVAWNSYGGYGVFVVGSSGVSFEDRGQARLRGGDAFLLVNRNLADLLSAVAVHCEFCKSRTADDWMQTLTMRLIACSLDRDCYIAAGVIAK